METKDLSSEDLILLFASDIEIQNQKIFIKKQIVSDSDLIQAYIKNTFKGSFEEKEKFEFIKQRIEKLNIDQISYNLNKHKTKFISILNKHYPAKLKEINDSPLGLFYRGNLDLLNETSIAIVGTRNPTKYGVNITSKIAKLFLEKDIVVISGLASGIDSYAHKAVSEYGKTIAVLGTGMDKIFPSENRNLFEEIIENNGLIITEYPPGTEGMPWNFPQRNRIISALSSAVIVVEGGLQSGSLITARFAIKQDKPLFAVPGPIDSPESNGPNMLIKSGVAELLTSVDDVLEKVKILSASGKQIKFDFKQEKKSLEGLTENQKRIYECIGESKINFDLMLSKIKCSSSELISEISILELKGYIEKTDDGNYKII